MTAYIMFVTVFSLNGQPVTGVNERYEYPSLEACRLASVQFHREHRGSIVTCLPERPEQ